VLKGQIPSVQIKTLVGSDNVDTWSSVEVWEKFLQNVRIVVSTYQILADVLSHAFLPIDRFALIVIDEGNEPPLVNVKIACG
jgi:ERCC4-related helicase